MWKLPLCAPRLTLTNCRARWPKQCASCLKRARASPQALPPCSITLQPLAEQRVIAFNSDSPHLPASVLETAFDALEARDLVVGPTHDGGYYLVGATASHSDLFASDGMGTANALEALLTRARALGLSVHLTDPFYDIDVEGDLSRLAAELQLAPARAPQTAAWLKQWERAAAQLRTARETCETHVLAQALWTRRHLACGADDLLTQARQRG